jgi:hypothetical protein
MQKHQEIFEKLMNATAGKNFPEFIALGDERFQSGIPKKEFDRVSNQLSSRMKAGYNANFLCDLKQNSFDTYVWKLTFSDKGTEFLARLSLKEDKVAEFLIN